MQRLSFKLFDIHRCELSVLFIFRSTNTLIISLVHCMVPGNIQINNANALRISMTSSSTHLFGDVNITDIT